MPHPKLTSVVPISSKAGKKKGEGDTVTDKHRDQGKESALQAVDRAEPRVCVEWEFQLDLSRLSVRPEARGCKDKNVPSQ